VVIANEWEPNRKLFLDHLPFILRGALVGAADSLWPYRKPSNHAIQMNE